MAATDKQIIDALKKAAEALRGGRALTPPETDDLVHRYKKSKGTHRQRSREALKGFTNLDDEGISKRASASDDVDRKVRDLEGLLND